ncbi:hypothetical protein TM1040_2913 [Ruegeria sp. TM1040]|nr:hypothetical protein TM1040_2913 [Ruegeria sp. TM1040]
MISPGWQDQSEQQESPRDFGIETGVAAPELDAANVPEHHVHRFPRGTYQQLHCQGRQCTRSRLNGYGSFITGTINFGPETRLAASSSVFLSSGQCHQP